MHAVNPPTLNEEAFIKGNRYALPAPRRYKVAWRFNSLLEQACHSNDVGYINIWDACCDANGLLKEEFELDGTHLDPEAIRFTLDKLLLALAEGTCNKTNYVRYSMVRARSANRVPHDTKDSEQPVSEVIKTSVDVGQFGPYFEVARTASQDGNYLEWVKATILPPGTKTLSFDAVTLKGLREILDEDGISSQLRSFFGADFIAVSCRGIDLRSCEPNNEALRLRVQAPACLLKAIFSVGEPLLIVACHAESIKREVKLEPGSLWLYNPSAFKEVVINPSSFFIEFTLMPRLSGQTLLIASASSVDWPADPFRYSLSGIEVYPPQAAAFSAPSVVFASTYKGEATSDFRTEMPHAVQQQPTAENRAAKGPHVLSLVWKRVTHTFTNILER